MSIAQAATEAGGIGALGLDLKALLFQVANFALLLIILRIFAYKPILNILERRRLAIEESLASAKAIEEVRAKMAAEAARAVAQARREAEAIIAASRRQASELLAHSEQRAREEAKTFMTQSRATINAELQQAREQLKQETLSLVALATERIIAVKLSPAQDSKLIEEALASAKALEEKVS